MVINVVLILIGGNYLSISFIDYCRYKYFWFKGISVVLIICKIVEWI